MSRHRVDEIEGGTCVVPRELHCLLDALRNLGVGERPLGEHRSIERCIGRHRVQQECAHHQQRHPPCVVGPDDAQPLQAIILGDVDGGDVVLNLLLVLLRDAPLPPRLRGLFDQALGELRQRGGGVVLEVEPLRVPPLVGR